VRSLALDTSGVTQALVLMEGADVGAADEWVRQPGSDPPLLSRLQALMKRLGWKPESLDRVAAGRGPGSFTGLRVGLSVAAGLAYGRGIQLYLVDSLEVLAGQALATAALRDAGRGEVYAWRPGRPAERISVKELPGWLRGDDRVVVEPGGALTAWAPAQAALEIPLAQRRLIAEALAVSAIEIFKRAKPVRYDDLQPFYSQPAAAEERLGKP
jgi:tRNA threonylcarbamoyladenosine biosynthesis protein TsaB